MKTKTFPEFPEETICLLCGTNDNKPCWLMPVTGTETGGNIEAVPIHVECTGTFLVDKLQYSRELNLVFATGHNKEEG